MIRELRKKFILVSMCSMMVVLLGIVRGILFAGYGRMVNRADQVLQMLAENNGEFPHMNPDRNPEQNDENKKRKKTKQNLRKNQRVLFLAEEEWPCLWRLLTKPDIFP